MWKGKLIFQRMRNVNGGKMVKTSKKVTGLRNSPGQNRMGPGIKRCNGSNRNPGCKDHGKTRKDLNGTELNGGVLGQWQEKRFQTGSMDTMTKASKRRMQEAPTLLVMETQAAQLRRVKNGNPRLFNGQTKWIKVECLNGRGHDDSVSSRIQIGTYIYPHIHRYMDDSLDKAQAISHEMMQHLFSFATANSPLVFWLAVSVRVEPGLRFSRLPPRCR